MALVNPLDPTVERVSACPVHFIWDGRGLGRSFVRAGFLGGLAAGMVGTAGQMIHLPTLTTAAVAVAGLSMTSWIVGQLLTLRAARAR